MKKFLFSVVLFTLPLLITAQNKKVAVYVMGEDAGINKVLGSKLVSAIARSEEYSAIERTSAFLAELSKEQNYQRTGAVDDSELSRLGKQFGVQYVCVAAVTEAFNEKYISARLIDVESAQVERTASSSGSIQSLQDVINAASSVSNDLLSYLGSSIYSNVKKVAVYIVKSDAAMNIGRVLGDKLVAGFTNSGRYVAIERTNSFLAQLNKEQNYQRTGAVDDNDLSRLGKQFGVQFVCVADVSDVFGEKFISARLIDVETAEVVNTYDVGGKIYDMTSCVQMANEIAKSLSKGTSQEQAVDDVYEPTVYHVGGKEYHPGDKIPQEDDVYDFAEEDPYFLPTSEMIDVYDENGKKTGTREIHYSGNSEGLFKWLSRHIKYPAIAMEQGIEGRVVCSFIVDRDGSISDVRVVKSSDRSLDYEAVRVLKSMPKWEPAKQGGRAVRYRYSIPLNFSLK